MTYKRPESVLVLVYTSQGEVLLLRRVLPPAGVWQSVTGSLRWQESAADAASRELQEETGLLGKPVTTNQLNRYEIVKEALHLYAPGIRENSEKVFELCLPERQGICVNSDEHSEYCWLPLPAAAERVWSWSNRAAIESLIERNPCFLQ